MSSWLQARVVCDDPLAALKQKPFYREQSQIREARRHAAVPDAWPEFLATATRQVTEKDIAKAKVINYTWKQSDSKITVTFSEPQSVEVSGKHVSSPLLSGDLFAEPRNVSHHGSVLEFESDVKWPVVIAGGSDIDGFSAFILAQLALANDSAEFFEFWLFKAADSGLVGAQQTYAWAMLTAQRAEEAMFWFYHCALTGSEFAEIVLAQFLMEATNENRDPCLAEDMLVRLVLRGNNEAWYYLGYLHVSSIDGFEGDPELGVKYLRKSVEVQGDVVAMRLLGQCMVNGFGCKKDVAAGMKMMEMARRNSDEEEEEEPEQEQRKSKVSWLDVGAIAVATACVAGTGLFFMKTLWRGKK